MTKNQSMLVFVVGLLITGFGVGGVENSITDMELLSAVVVAGAGLMTMGVGVRGIQIAGDY